MELLLMTCWLGLSTAKRSLEGSVRPKMSAIKLEALKHLQLLAVEQEQVGKELPETRRALSFRV